MRKFVTTQVGLAVLAAGYPQISQIELHCEAGFSTCRQMASWESHPTCCEGVPVLGSTDEIVSLVRKTGAGSVIVALKNLPHSRMLELIGRCRGEKVDFKIVSDLFEIITGPVGVEEIDGIPVFGLKEEPLHGWTNRALKRVVDVAISSIALVAALVIFPFIAEAAAVAGDAR